MPIARHLTYIRGEADRAQFHPCAAAGTGGCARGAGCGRDELAVQFEQRPLLRGVVVVIGGDARSDGDEHGGRWWLRSAASDSSAVRFAVFSWLRYLLLLSSFSCSFSSFLFPFSTNSERIQCVRTPWPLIFVLTSHSSTSAAADTSGWNTTARHWSIRRALETA